MSKVEMNKKIDSINTISASESSEHAKRDLQKRLKIEVRYKVDSIINAHARQNRGDSSKPAPQSERPPLLPM